MRTWIVFLLAALPTREVLSSHIHYKGPTHIPHVLHNGYLADTHEVAAAKTSHLAAQAAQSLGHEYGGSYGYAGSYGDNDGNNGYSSSYGGHHGHGDFRYYGPIAVPHVLHDGHIADTHEVAAAKTEYFAAVAKAKAHSDNGHDYTEQYSEAYNEHYAAPYHGPLFKPVVLKSGYLADTHEVAAAKHHHLETLHKASRYGH